MKTPVLPEWLRPPASWKVWESPHSQAAEKRGLSPGTLIADPEAEPTRVRLIAYGPDRIEEIAEPDADTIRRCLETYPVTWVDVSGLAGLDRISALGELFGIHPLALEDVLHTHQRPKLESYDNHLFFVGRMWEMAPHLISDQLSLFLGGKFALTFQERIGDCFDPVRGRIRGARGRIRSQGPDYLAYALLDSLVDSFFPILETYGETLERLEQTILARPDESAIASLHAIKRDLLRLRRSVWPLRDALNSLFHTETDFVRHEIHPYLRDCLDHLLRVAEFVESDREIASSLMDFYLSSASHRMNEIMRTLTIIATIFIPLGFVAGIYGMNFDSSISKWNMPETRWKWGYPAALLLMAAISAGMLFYFWRKGWIGNRNTIPPPPEEEPSPDREDKN